ncbi:hypothetical protein DDB_G0289549 [Dictyostelium discoideum AX4]|uniref:Uncharacterized protein n=1 Tax=Dictyostelium discoideum TaxID=44689 RepID=Q54HC9_DICDI|nr:hypothetical protein DDB_G0289549 [Dictyostelium discoideum AX4]EAL62670.1 hypothetical protein DDB_G0289549 [Dictyostelium discoideum AX4]|eukprot:XP_636173.1 hypothetical protein DDB_G0289549 [Dictyostelium discoideum AX4]
MVSHDIIDMITLTGKGHYRQRIEVFLIADPTFTKEEKQKIMKIIDAFSSALPDEKIEKAIINECEKYLNSTLVFKRILGSIRPSFIGKL